MGIASDFPKVQLFAGFIYQQTETYEHVVNQMESQFSAVDVVSPEIDFDKTTYYEQEMGSPLVKRFVAFTNLIAPDELPAIKIFCNQMENTQSVAGSRRINIDPGYLSNANVVIATTKNYYHRIPLTGGIYAHMEYVFKKNRVETLPWTYPDFRSDDYIAFFKELREIYRAKIRHLNNREPEHT